MNFLKIGLFGALITMAAEPVAIAQSAFDPQTEINTIINTYILTAAKDSSDALNMVASDPQKACSLSKHASISLTTADQKLANLHEKLLQNHYDPSPLQAFQDQLKGQIGKHANAEHAICSGEMTKELSNPTLRAISQKIGGYMSIYGEDYSAIKKAQQNSDNASYCSHVKNMNIHLKEFDNYVSNTRKNTHLPQAGIVEIDKLSTTISSYRNENNTRLLQCKISP